MSDAVVIAIGVAAINAIALGVVAYFQYGVKKDVQEVHQLTNSRLNRIEKALEAMTADRDRLRDVVERSSSPPNP